MKKMFAGIALIAFMLITLAAPVLAYAESAEGQVVERADILPCYSMYKIGHTQIASWKRTSKGWTAYDSRNTQLRNIWGSRNNQYYLFQNGLMVTGWFEVPTNRGSTVFYFSDTGQMATYWEKVDGDWHYFYNNGQHVENGWIKHGPDWYYIRSGTMYTGWLQENGKWYCFNKANGNMVSGWVQDNGKWYYMLPNGEMSRNCWVKGNAGWYYLSSNGTMVTSGWVKYGISWYYMKEDGLMVHSGKYKIGSKIYEFDESGKMM